MNTNIIGNRIKGLLEQQQISQQELANKIDIIKKKMNPI